MPLFTNENEVNVANFPAVQPVSGPLTDAELRATAVPVSGPLTDAQLRATPVPVSIQVSGAGTSVVTRVPVSPTVTTLQAANPNRRKLILHNESGTLFVKLGTGASSTDYSYRLTANTTLEITDAGDEVTAVKASGSSSVQVTEIV